MTEVFDMQVRMSSAEAQLLRKLLSSSSSYLEFGMGGSTTLAVTMGIQTTSVESDMQWIRTVEQAVAKLERGHLLRCYHADIGEVGEWGAPKSNHAQMKWASYAMGVWEHLEREPDFVLIDGRFRVACALATLLTCPLIPAFGVHDFRDGAPFRAGYELILHYAEIIQQTGTLFVFRPKTNIDKMNLMSNLHKMNMQYY